AYAEAVLKGEAPIGKCASGGNEAAQAMAAIMGVSKKIDTALGMGMAVTFVMAIASAACYAVNVLLVKLGLDYMQTVAFILVIAAIVQVVEMFLKKSVPALYKALGVYLPLITTNCAVLGVVLVNVQKGYNFLLSVVNGAAGGLGFTVAIVLFASVRERVNRADFRFRPGAGEPCRLSRVLQGLPHRADFRRTAGACLHGLLRPEGFLRRAKICKL
ncbi:MAG: hypothetical protein BHW31_01350, partial [Firmicutes bacterium CAG:110_56_8]